MSKGVGSQLNDTKYLADGVNNVAQRYYGGMKLPGLDRTQQSDYSQGQYKDKSGVTINTIFAQSLIDAVP